MPDHKIRPPKGGTAVQELPDTSSAPPAPDRRSGGKRLAADAASVQPRPRRGSDQLRTVTKRERLAYLSRRLLASVTDYKPLPALVLMPIRIAPDVLVENRPAWVEFYLWNRAAAPITDAFVRVRIDAKHSIHDYPGMFEFPIRSLATEQTVLGAVSFTLPRADLGNKLTLELCRWGEIPAGGEFGSIEILASAELEFDVAARFSVGWQGIHIRDTASIDDDTLFVSFTGRVGEQLWQDTASLGDVDNTGRGGIPPKVLPVGPFDMLPGSGGAVAFGCVIANMGHTSAEEDAKNALKVVSHIGAVTATTIMSILFPFGAGVWALLSQGADELHQAIINWALAICDTVVLNDGRLISEQEMFLATFDPKDSKSDAYLASWAIHTRKKAGEFLAEWLGPGCRDSDYAAHFSVHRHEFRK